MVSLKLLLQFNNKSNTGLFIFIWNNWRQLNKYSRSRLPNSDSNIGTVRSHDLDLVQSNVSCVSCISRYHLYKESVCFILNVYFFNWLSKNWLKLLLKEKSNKNQSMYLLRHKYTSCRLVVSKTRFRNMVSYFETNYKFNG